MSRFLLVAVSFAIAIASIGCCGPMGCGPGCGTADCFDCDGAGYGKRMIPARPLDGLRQFRKSLVCGSGCGEVYYDEWISTPPDCADPCCGDQFVGGAVPCRPGCWEPGSLLRRLYTGRLLGGRYCSGDESSAPCGCGETSCDGGCGWSALGRLPGRTVMATPAPMSSAPVTTGSDCGCAQATSPVAVRRHMAQHAVPAADRLTR